MNQIFNFNGAQVRVLDKSGEPWFVLKDVCDVLGLRSIHVKERLTDDIVSTDTVPDSLGRPNKATIINEDGLYEVILDSRKPEAKAFRKWITSEVLPTIRKRGAYLTPAKIEEVLLNPDTLIQLATNLKNEQALRLAAESKLTEQQPLVTFAEICIQSDKSIRIRDFAHSLSSHGIKVGEKRLYQQLRDWKYIEQKSTEPTQKAVELGLFEVVTGAKEKPNGEPFTWRTTYVTTKGQAHIANRLKRG